MYTIKGKNPTELYYETMNDVINDGDEVSPRGKLVKELRPAAVEFENPYNRVTFLGGRRINPFFQIAESLWILSGRADVDWLIQYNSNMKTFSDDGKWFNASYGERIRSYGKNALHNTIINPVDQLMDVYTKLIADKDTRQAVIVISHPQFDNSKYTIGEMGKDIACNLVITFKIRHDKLNMTVFNRSNDVHWGLYGANLCQFTTLQEVVLTMLKNSGKEEFNNLEIGTYCQVTDSLHIYLDDYGAKCTDGIIDYYKTHSENEVGTDFSCKNEPRMNMSKDQFNTFLNAYWTAIDPYLSNDSFIMEESNRLQLLELIDDFHDKHVIDNYWIFAIKSMLSYRLVRLKKMVDAVEILNSLEDCQWKISMLFFLKTFIHKQVDEGTNDFKAIEKMYDSSVQSLKKALAMPEHSETLENYIKL